MSYMVAYYWYVDAIIFIFLEIVTSFFKYITIDDREISYDKKNYYCSFITFDLY
jgi:hypothetical protein